MTPTIQPQTPKRKPQAVRKSGLWPLIADITLAAATINVVAMIMLWATIAVTGTDLQITALSVFGVIVVILLIAHMVAKGKE